VNEEKLRGLAEILRENLYEERAGGAPGGPGVKRDNAMNAMIQFLEAHGYVVGRLGDTAEAREQLLANLGYQTELFTAAIEERQPSKEVAAAQRDHSADIRDALKWVAAFSTAGLFLLAQMMRRPVAPFGFYALSEVVGLVIAAAAFATSVAGAGLFLFLVDTRWSAWLRGVIAKVLHDSGRYRSAMWETSNARRALMRGDLIETTAAMDRAEDEVKDIRDEGEGAMKLPELGGLERFSIVLCVTGFAIGVAAVAGDFIAKMPASP
jgi:hypothetical protein